MTKFKYVAAVLVTCWAISPVLAQGSGRGGVGSAGGSSAHTTISAGQATMGGGQSTTTGTSLGDIASVLQEGGLAAVLSDQDMAMALGLEFDQWLMAQFIISEFSRLEMTWMMIDPEG